MQYNARCDLTPALAHCAAGWNSLTLVYARSTHWIERSRFHCLGRQRKTKTPVRYWSCTLRMKFEKMSAISEKPLASDSYMCLDCAKLIEEFPNLRERWKYMAEFLRANLAPIASLSGRLPGAGYASYIFGNGDT